MPFNKRWFDTLATLTDDKLSHVSTRPRRVPSVENLLEEDLVDPEFAEPIDDVVRELADRGHRLGTRIRAEPKHVYTYPQGKAYKRQKNIGFYGTDSPRMRIGVGLRLEERNSESAVEQLEAFLRPIAENPGEFDDLYRRLGGYSELMSEDWYPPDVNQERPSAKFTDRRREEKGDWMFYGAQLRREDPAHRWILADVGRVSDFAAEVFEVIGRTPFG